MIHHIRLPRQPLIKKIIHFGNKPSCLFEAPRRKIQSLPIILFLFLILNVLFCFPYQCQAKPIWPDDPNRGIIDEDRIGYEDGEYVEFIKYDLDPNEIIEYRIGDSNWSDFPHKLYAKNKKPHTVYILFDTNADVGPQNLMVSVIKESGSPAQYMGVFFDGRPIHSLLGIRGEEINRDFEQFTFWLGHITKGNHTITITNETTPDPGTSYGFFFDYFKLASAPRRKTFIPDNYSTIRDGIQASTPGDIIIVKQGTYQEHNTLILKSGITLRSWSGNVADPNDMDPYSTIITGEGKIGIYGAYETQIKGFTIKNSDIGIMVSHDRMTISNTILSNQTGVFLTGQDLNFVNNTIIPDDCGLYVCKSDHNMPLPSIQCRNNIFGDGNCPIYVLTEPNTEYSIDPVCMDQVIKVFSYNTIWTTFESNVHLKNFGSTNMQLNPYFVDSHNDDYHLWSYSPCIDAGDPNSDFSREPKPNNGGRINMGAFGNTSQAEESKDTDGDGAFDYFEGLEDINQDGQPDRLDRQIAVFRTSTGQGFKSENGFGRIGLSLHTDANTTVVFENVRALNEHDPEISALTPPELHYYYGFWEFEISGMKKGAEVTIAVLCPQGSPFFDLLEYYSYGSDNEWSARPIEKDPIKSFLYIELSDGDAWDRDTSENGSIVHEGAIAVPLSLREYDYKSCFISAL